MVGVAGFEPAATRSQAEYSTKLSYTPILEQVVGLEPTIPTWKDGVLPITLYLLILKYCCSTDIHFIISLFNWSRQRDLNPRPDVYKTPALPTELWRLTSRHLFLVLPITPQFIRTDRTRTYIFIVNMILRIRLLTVSFIVTLNQLLVTHLGLEPRTPWLMVVNVRTALTHILININIFIKIMLFTLIYQVKCSTTELIGHTWCSCRDSNPNGLRQRILSPPCIPSPSQLQILII